VANCTRRLAKKPSGATKRASGGSRRFGSRYQQIAARRVNHGHPLAHQFRSQRRQAIIMTVRKTEFDCEIATFDEAHLA
jgi:hypothetical protein